MAKEFYIKHGAIVSSGNKIKYESEPSTTSNNDLVTKQYVDATVSGVSVSFTDLTDTPTTYESGKYLQTTSSGIEFISPPSAGTSTFLDLTDTPTTYSGVSGKYLRTTASGIEFTDVNITSSFLDLTDTPATYSGFEGSYLRVTASGVEFSNVDQDLVISNFKAYEIVATYEYTATSLNLSIPWDSDVYDSARIIIKGTTSVASDLALRFNSDSTVANYHSAYYFQTGSSADGNYQTGYDYITIGSGSTSNSFYSIDIEMPSDGDKFVQAYINCDAGSGVGALVRTGTWNQSVKVSSIDLSTLTGNFVGTIEVYKFKKVTLPNQRYSADGIQSIQVTYKDADEIYINPGTVSIMGDTTNDLYQVETQLTKQLTSLSTDTWYYIYVKPPGDGLILSASEVEYSTTAPTEDVSKNGFYHGTNTNWRCIFAVYSDASSNISKWWIGSNKVKFTESIQFLDDIYPSNSWTDVTIATPLFGNKSIATIGVYTIYSNANAVLNYRVNGETINVSEHRIAYSNSGATRSFNEHDLSVDISGILEVSWNTATTNIVQIASNGFVLPINIYTGATQIKPKNVFARGIQSLKVEYKDADEIYINPGTIHIKTDTTEEYYTVYSQLTKQLTGLSTDTWYYIYVDPPDSGYMLTAQDIEYSSTAPTRNLTKLGWYHPTNTDQRCIFAIYSDSSSNIYEWWLNDDKVRYINEIYDVSALDPDTTWTDATLTVPLFGDQTNCYVLFYATATGASQFRWRPNGSTDVDGSFICGVTADSDRESISILVRTDSSGIIEVKSTASTSNTIYIYSLGYDLPDYMYTGPAYLGGSGGYDNMLDEDDFASNSDTNTASQQSIKAYVDATVSGVGSGSSSFLELTDTPSVYESGKYLQTTSSGIEFTSPFSDNVKTGRTTISGLSDSIYVNFSVPFSNDSYSVSYSIANTTDISPSFYTSVLTSKSNTGFGVTLSSGTNTGNYVLEWSAIHD